MSSILPHKHIEEGFAYEHNDELTIYEQNINNDYLMVDDAFSYDYDLFFYMYQMNAQNEINSYNDNLPDTSIGDISLMLF